MDRRKRLPHPSTLVYTVVYMHTRRLASFLLGMWLGGILLMLLVSAQSSATAGKMLDSPAPPMKELIKIAGADAMRALLSHAAAEQRRAHYGSWEIAQMFLGATLALHLLLGARESLLPAAVTLAMLSIVVAVHFLVTPDLIGFGRAVDFLEEGNGLPDRARAAAFERAYLASELVKLGLGTALLAYFLYRKSGRKRLSRTEIDAVDHADHSHVDR